MFFITFLYIHEIVLIFLFFCFSLVLCLIVSFIKVNSLLIYSFFFVSKFTGKKILILGVFEILNTSSTLSFFYSFLFLLPLFSFFLNNFVISSLYDNQAEILNKQLSTFILFNYIQFFIVNFIILAILLTLLLSWIWLDADDSFFLFSIHLNLRYSSSLWLSFNYTFLFMVHLMIFCFNFYKTYRNVSYFFYKKNKRQMFFFYFLLIQILFADIYLSFFLFLCLFIAFEIYYFFVCYMVSQKCLIILNK